MQNYTRYQQNIELFIESAKVANLTSSDIEKVVADYEKYRRSHIAGVIGQYIAKERRPVGGGAFLKVDGDEPIRVALVRFHTKKFTISNVHAAE
ncbi:hypothetical protein ACFOU2_13515 [Bacillus songklensis]|uniref:Uncharacterized protein n=2 Tax=Bacillus songklensis TaxID=1069116 RepID=A0ABV8B5I6_9BACI